MPETDPTTALNDAENAVGGCIENAWSESGYNNLFDEYLGNGLVEFRTGTRSDPTGSTGESTLLYVTVYANGTMEGLAGGGAGVAPSPSNAALSYWGCAPYENAPVAHPGG